MTLIQARKALGLTQKALSEHIGIPRRTLEDWEAGKRTPPAYVERLIIYWLSHEAKTADWLDEGKGKRNADREIAAIMRSADLIKAVKPEAILRVVITMDGQPASDWRTLYRSGSREDCEVWLRDHVKEWYPSLLHDWKVQIVCETH